MTVFYTEPEEACNKTPMTNSKLLRGFSNDAMHSNYDNPLKLSIDGTNKSVSLIGKGERKPKKILSTISKMNQLRQNAKSSEESLIIDNTAK